MTLPQKEINWGPYPIYQIKLAGRVKRKSGVNLGMISKSSTAERWNSYCISSGGFTECGADPHCIAQKPDGRTYERWEIIIPALRYLRAARLQSMVRFDGTAFDYYLDQA